LSFRKPSLCVFRGVSTGNLSGEVGFLQFLRHLRPQNAVEQAELIVRAALDPAIAIRARWGASEKSLDHIDLLHTVRN